jgi:gluconokinase
LTPFVLAIDIGTTSTKALAVQPNGVVLETQQRYYPTQYPKPGFADQDANQIFEAVKEALTTAVANVPSGFQLAGICFSSAMHSLMAVDHLGNSLTPLVIWADTRSAAQAKELRNTQVGKKLHDQTGTAIHPMSPLCKLLWWRNHEPKLFERAHKFISIKEYIIYQLCSEYVVDYSVASATGLFDLNSLDWSTEALSIVGISQEKLSKPVPHDHPVKIVSSLGNPELNNVPVFMGANDGCLAQLGSSAMNDGDLTITLGTSGAVRRVEGKQFKDVDRKLFRYLLTKDIKIVGGATNNGTVILDWFGREFVSSTTSMIDLVKLASAVPAGCDGLLALPFLQGERAPMYNPDAKGVFFNVTLRHTRAHFIKALMEGICFELRSIVKSVETACGISKRVLISGGIIHAPEWVQLLSTILGKELIVSGAHDASALGAAEIAFKALQIPFNHNSSAELKFSPDMTQSGLYQKQFETFESLYDKVESQFSC